MRVTNGMTANLLMQELYKNKQLLFQKQVTVATEKIINKPSDDPIGMGKVLDYRRILSSTDQYFRNITVGQTNLQITETALEQIEAHLVTAKKIASQRAATDSADQTDLDRDLAAVQGIYDDIMSLANTKVGDSFIFGGHRNNTIPITRNADGIDGTADDYVATYNGDDGELFVHVGEGQKVKVNANGRDVFDVGGIGGGTDVFDALNDLINAISANDKVAAETQITRLESASDQVQAVAIETSVYYNRLDMAENRLISYEKNIQDMLGEIENADMAQAIVELQLQETAYTTSLEVASRIIQPSLVDYV